MNLEYQKTQAQSRITKAFQDAPSEWRKRATICLLRAFERRIETYAKMIVCAPEDLQAECTAIGRGAAAKVQQMCDRHPGDITVYFMEECNHPRVEAVKEHDGKLCVSIYFDFGVSSAADGAEGWNRVGRTVLVKSGDRVPEGWDVTQSWGAP